MKALHGVYPATVTDNVDPDQAARVKVRLPETHMGQTGIEAWARIATLMAGNNRGTWFIPDVGDEVLVAFEAGDVRFPFILGSLWSGADTPPANAGIGNNQKLLRSRNGLTIAFDDQDGRESIVIATAAGQAITLRDGPGSVVISDSNGNDVTLAPAGVTVSASSRVTLKATVVEIDATMVSVNASVSRFGGIVQCDLLITDSVVSDSYTPGAGNIW